MEQDNWHKEFQQALDSTPAMIEKIDACIARLQDELKNYSPPVYMYIECHPEFYRKMMSFHYFKSKRQWREVRKSFGGDKVKWIAWKESRGHF